MVRLYTKIDLAIIIEIIGMYDVYNTIKNHEWIPKQAFLYLPSGSSNLKQQDDYKMIVRNQIKRLIYEGDIQYVEQEIQKLKDFQKFLKTKQIVLDKRWNKAYLYKFLQSANYDFKKALKQILAHNQYKADLDSKDFQELRKHVEPILKQGPFYFNGRDAKYRPIIVCDIAKIHQMKLTDDELYKSLQYFFEFLYRNMLINGQVQNVVGIIDVGLTSPFDLVKPMKMTIGFLQGNYKYKLHAIYIIQSTNTFQLFYGIAKHLMKQDTIRKICVVDKGKAVPQLLQYTNPLQLEERFGGSHPNLTKENFWPPRQFSDDYSHPSVSTKIITQQQYKHMYINGHLPARKIYRDFVEDETDLSYDIPLLNEHRATQNVYKRSSVIMVQKNQKNLFQKAIYKMSCISCFGARRHNQKKQKNKIKQ